MKRRYSYKEFLQLTRFIKAEHRDELVATLKNATKPQTFAGKQVPNDLNLVSYGLLDDLSNIAKSGAVDPVAEGIAKILDIKIDEVYEGNVFDVFGMGIWIGKELERINKMFKSISPRYTNEEISAGVKALNFGSFGVLDWYAHRQGIADQNEVREVAWVRIFTCMKNDAIKAEYEKRLNDQYIKKQHHGKK